MSPSLFGDIADDPDLTESYRAAGGALDLDAAARFRLAAYRVYLYLIMLVEMVPRGTDTPEEAGFRRLVAKHLQASVGALS